MYVPHERRAIILRLLEQRGYLRSARLAQELGVTEETIRTDLIALHERRLLTRVHGGARFVPPTGGDEDGTRPDCQLLDLLLPHLRAGMCLYVDNGAMAVALLARLGEMPCSILTPAPRLLLQLAAKAMPQQGISPEGPLEKESQLISAQGAAEFFARCRPDAAVLFPQALPARGHVAYHHATRAEWAAAAVRAAGRTIITTPAHVFYNRAPHSVAAEPHLLITEDNVPPEFDGLPMELIPYLSPEDLRRESETLEIYD